MTTPTVTSSTDSQMHNNIMAAVQAVAATDNSLAIPEHMIVETPMNMSLENKAHYQVEKEAIHMILTGIGDEIYSTVDAYQTVQEIWEAIKRTVNVAGARENVGSPVVKQSGIQCFNYTDEEINKQELEARYSYMAKIQENDQNDVECDDERVALANSKLDVDENKKIQKKLKKANTTLAQELKECKTILARTSKTLGESNSVRDSCLVALQNKQTEFEKYKAFNDRTIDYDKLERRLNETLGQLAQKDIEIKEDLKAQLQDKNIAISELKKLIEKGKGKFVETKFDKPFIVRQPNAQRIPKPSVLGKPTPFSNSLERRYFPKTNSVPQTNVSEGVNHKTNVSRPQHKSNQLKDKVVPNNSQVKLKKTQVEVHPRIPSISNKMKSVTACNNNLNSRTSNANDVCATCNKCLVDSNHFACVTKVLNDVMLALRSLM
nr:hypothetical protein [Tanacetum cinerariifolium]